MAQNDDHNDPRMRLRPNPGDRLYDQQLQRDLQLVNEQTLRALGPLPPEGLPVQPKRKPRLTRPAVPPTTPTAPPSDEDTTMQWKSAMAVAALATGSALSACGAETTAVQVDPPADPVVEASLPVQASAARVVPPAEELAKATPSSAADEQPAEPKHGLAIPEAQLRTRILALLDSFQRLEDLERENVARRMQVELVKRATMEDGHQYFGTTTEGWDYRVGVSRLGRRDEPPTILIDLDEGVEPWTDQQPTYCTLEFEPLAKELVAMGYERAEGPSRFGGNTTWWFKRATQPHRTSVAVGVGLYSIQGSPDTRTCILSLRIGGNADE